MVDTRHKRTECGPRHYRAASHDTTSAVAATETVPTTPLSLAHPPFTTCCSATTRNKRIEKDAPAHWGLHAYRPLQGASVASVRSHAGPQ